MIQAAVFRVERWLRSPTAGNLGFFREGVFQAVKEDRDAEEKRKDPYKEPWWVAFIPIEAKPNRIDDCASAEK